MEIILDKGSVPVYDNEILNYIETVLHDINFKQLTNVSHADLDLAWRNWLQSSSYNTVIGLEQFKHSSFTAGTTPCFSEFIGRHNTRRIRISNADFILTSLVAKTYNREIVYLEDAPLEKNDCVIISVPFSGNGNLHPLYPGILDTADALDIPVMIDAAYFGISHGIQYTLTHPCITDFCVSLSKNFSTQVLRLGIRFTKEIVDDGISAGVVGHNVFDRLGSFISINLLNQFSHDWFITRYRPLALEVCQLAGLESTNTVTFGLGTPDMTKYQRGDYVRVCISKTISRLSSNS
jgi:hypothetical protein